MLLRVLSILMAYILYPSSVHAYLGILLSVTVLANNRNIILWTLSLIICFLIQLFIMKKMFKQEELPRLFWITLAMNVASGVIGFFIIMTLDFLVDSILWEIIDKFTELSYINIIITLSIIKFLALSIFINTYIEFVVPEESFSLHCNNKRALFWLLALSNLFSIFVKVLLGSVTPFRS